MTATATTEIRSRREQLDVSRMTLAIRSGVSITWLAAIEAGLRPRGEAFERVERCLDELEREAAEFRLEPGVGVSGYRGDTDRPEAA
jgi:predicted transcriptional regulator